MPRTVVRRSRAPLRRGSPRQVEIARAGVGSGFGVATSEAELLTSWIADAGLLTVPAGITIVGIKYRLAVGNVTTAANNVSIVWGIQVVGTDTDPDDLNPRIEEHQNWMEWGRFIGDFPVGVWRYPNGNGDDGFRTVRSMRKISGIEQKLVFVINASSAVAGLSFDVGASIAMKLP
jgi:hypothetical protein